MPQEVRGELFNSTPPFAEYINNYALVANTARNITVPAGYKYALFACNQPAFYACTVTTAAVPTVDVVDGTGSELNPTRREVDTGDVISVISPTTGKLTVSFYDR